MNEQLITNLWYTIAAFTDCDVETPCGVTIHLPAGIQYFHFADTDSIYISGQYKLTQNPPLFKPASAAALGGGFIEGNMNVGHGASAAVAAQCMLTPGDLAAGGTLADSNGQSVELEDPHKYAEGYLAFRDATEACTLTIGEWSKAWAEKKDAKASGTFLVMGDEGTICVSGIEVPIPDDPADEAAWNAAFSAAECGIVCTAVDQHGEIDVSVEASEVGEAGNSIVISVGSYEPVTLTGGSTARTKQDVVDAIASDADCPVHASLDADETAISLTAKEYGSNDTISVDGDMFANWSGMSGGHGDYTVAELVTAIGGGFDDITPTAGETEGVITLTANDAGAAANSIEYTATGCFGSGTVKQGSTTRGKNAVTQTAFKIYLNGAELPVAPVPTALTPTTAMKNGGVYTVAAAGTALNYSAVTTGVNATARIWLDYNDTTDVQWPPEWVWLTDGGTAPKLDFFKRYKLEIENDTVATTAKVADVYSYEKEYAFTALSSSNYASDELELYLLPAETNAAYATDAWNAFMQKDTKHTTFHKWTAFKNMLGEDFKPDQPQGYSGTGSFKALTFMTKQELDLHGLVFGTTRFAGGAEFVLQAWADGMWQTCGDLVTDTGDEKVRTLIVSTHFTANKWRLLMAGRTAAEVSVSHIRLFEEQ